MFFISDMLDNSSITYYYTIAIFSKIVGCGLKLLQLNLVDMVWRLLLFICKMAGTHQGEDDWKEHEAVEEAKDNHEKEHFEEDNKRIIVWCCQQDHGKKCGQPSIEHGRAHL